MANVCAWCHNPLLQTKKNDDESVSHGMCKDCFSWIKRNDTGRALGEFIDDLPVPVIMVNSDCTVDGANACAQALTGKSYESIHSKRAGEVMECRNARLPGGCGNTIHCRACTIRNTVMGSWQDGEAREMVPAYLDTITCGGEKRIRYLISTVRLGDKVLLRIDDAGDA
ncbi:MAG: hypothetical protein GF401_05940 [Chitinivibrionales bacterium]|nr:hypothetical protein [Chitinivibrionales bacterium]